MRNRGLNRLVLLAAALAMGACSPVSDSSSESVPAAESSYYEPSRSEETIMKVYAHVGTNSLEINLADNSSAVAFVELLSKGDLTISMSDYGDFEKVGSLGTTLPRNDERIVTEPGDVILYQGNSITIYYDTNTWTFTRLGKIEGATRDSLLDILGEGDVEVTFSLN